MDLDATNIYFGIININAGFSGVCGIIITRRKNLHESTDAAADGFYFDGRVARVY
jgi:hypothetical protein